MVDQSSIHLTVVCFSTSQSLLQQHPVSLRFLCSLGCFQRRRLCSFLNVASKQRMAVLLLFSVIIMFMASDFHSAVDISFLCDMAHKIICNSEKALPEGKSKIKFKFPSTIVHVKNKKIPWYQ